MTFDEAMKSLELKFSSGNNIPVERATIIDKEWQSIKTEIERLNKLCESEFYQNNKEMEN